MITDFMNEINAISNDANSVNSRSDNDVRTPKQVQSSSEIASITGVASSCRYGSEWYALVVIGTIRLRLVAGQHQYGDARLR